MPNIFGEKQPGSEGFSCLSDPRWNWNHTVDDLVISSGPSKTALAVLEKMKTLYGEVPADHKWYAHKY